MTDKRRIIELNDAAERGDSSRIKVLLATLKQEDVNSKIGGHQIERTALHRAAAHGHLEAVRLLLKVCSP